MRNVFDQYSQPENRITHALMTALNEDRQLLDAFLADVAQYVPGTKNDPLQISEQSYPGSIASSGMDEAEGEGRGIPDAWITAGEHWCLIIENKVLGAPSSDQLRRHLATARKLGFTRPKALLLTARQPGGRLPEGVEVVTWGSIYNWLSGQTPHGTWAHRLATYLEVMEARLTDSGQMETGSLTEFNGFRFGEGAAFSYLEGKRVLQLAVHELRKRADLAGLGIDPGHSGRKAIRGQEDGNVWDFLAFASTDLGKSFTAYPHLSLVLNRTRVLAMVTLPNGARISRRRLTGLDSADFLDLIDCVFDNMRPILSACPGMEPRMRVLQRHWTNRSTPPFLDADIDIDLRTRCGDGAGVKLQPEWIRAAFDVVRSRNSNIEMQVGAAFPYRTCAAIQRPEALDFLAAAWIACKPYIVKLGIL